jgi:putative salt-induced outer membrane protein YdiY
MGVAYSGAMSSLKHTSLVVVCLLGVATSSARAQDAPPEPKPVWSGSFGAGLSLTRGNSDTTNLNASYEVKRDPNDHFVFTSKGLFLRSDQDDALTASRLGLEARIDRKLTERTSLFAQVQYLRDRFKEIDYLVSPTVGISQYLVKSDATELDVNVSVGGVWEKNPNQDTNVDGALNAGQRFRQKISETAEFTERVTALWKLSDFDDSLYTFGLGVAASVTTRTQLKFEIIDTYKNKPPTVDVKKNDVSMLVSFVFKF